MKAEEVTVSEPFVRSAKVREVKGVVFEGRHLVPRGTKSVHCSVIKTLVGSSSESEEEEKREHSKEYLDHGRSEGFFSDLA